jgi:hypothetical protein
MKENVKHLYSPIRSIKPRTVEFCIRIVILGEPLTETTVINFVNDLIPEGEYSLQIFWLPAKHEYTEEGRHHA